MKHSTRRRRIYTRRRLPAAVAAMFAVGVLLTACSSGTASSSNSPNSGGTAPAVTKVRLGDSTGAIAQMPLYVALAGGFWSRNGLSVSTVQAPSGSSLEQLLVSGQVDFTQMDIASVVAANEKGANIRIVGSMGQYYPFKLICRPGSGASGTYPAAMKSLEGKTIGLAGLMSAPEELVRYTVLSGGADPSKVQYVALGGIPQMIAGFVAKTVDCEVGYEPVPTQMTAQHIPYNVIVDWASPNVPAKLENYTASVVVTTESYASQHPEVVDEMREGLAQAIAFGKSPSNASRLQGELGPYFPGTSSALIADYIRISIPLYGNAPTVTTQQFQNALDVYNAAFKPSVPLTGSLANVSIGG
jgi:ABC-type nitrate/sulfonate/bicarbonate transport system substrate-binding protein